MSDKLEDLKVQATELGISFHPSIGEDKLQEKIDAHLAASDSVDNQENTEDSNVESEDVKGEDTETVDKSTVTIKDESNLPANRAKFDLGSIKREEGEAEGAYRVRLRKAASKLVRVNITCMNPNKKDHQGEIFSASNALMGTFKRFVPFNTVDGWHIERVLLNMIKERRYQQFYWAKASNGEKIRKGKLVPEFAIEYLEPLTKEELKELASQQALAGGVED